MKFAHRRTAVVAELTKPDTTDMDEGEFAPETGGFRGAFSPTPPAQEPQNSKGLQGSKGELGGFSDPLYARRDIDFGDSENIRFPVGSLGKSPQTPPSPPETGLKPAEISQSRGGGVLRQTPLTAWVRHVDGLRHDRPLAGLNPAQWRTYREDARWLIDSHGSELASAGFSIGDVFEIVPGHRDTGGLVEMLRGARSIIIDGLGVSFRRGAVSIHFEAAGGDPIKTGWIGRAPWQP